MAYELLLELAKDLRFRGAGAHTREEYVEIDSLAEGYETAFRMIFDLS